MELGQNLWVGRCCDLIFLALGAGSGLLASSMGCKIRLRALMNLPRGKSRDWLATTQVMVCVRAQRGLVDSRLSALIHFTEQAGV